MDKTNKMLERWCAAPGIEFDSAEAKEEYKKRAERISNAVRLKAPDRVPIALLFGVFPALDNGYSAEDILFDRTKAYEAFKKSIVEFQADSFRYRVPQGGVLEAIESTQIKLPGRGIPCNSNLQFVESECESPEDFYDAFLNDPTDFILRVHWPKISRIFEPFKQLPSVHAGFSYYLGLPGIIPAFGKPGLAEAFQKLFQAGAAAQADTKLVRTQTQQLMQMGFPADAGGLSHAPFDTVGDFIRGTRGIMLDMFQRPDKLIAAMEKLVPIMIEMGLQAKNAASPFVFMPLHKGSDNFMSLEQYKTFYWPTLRKVMIGLIEEGLIPVLHFQGNNTSRLKVIRDIPMGKAVYHFEKVDIHKAKEVLGDIVCFKGNVPVSLLFAGTAADVRAYVKKLIDIIGKDGGLIVDCGTIFDEAQHENVKAMVEFTKEYGRN